MVIKMRQREIIFTDTETLSHDWLAGFKFKSTGERVQFHNDRKGLINFLNRYRDACFVAYNMREYDQYIFKALQCGFNPKFVNDYIISKNGKGWQLFKNVDTPPFYFYDCITNPPLKLKRLEGHAGVSIEESPIPFDIKRPLTASELSAFKRYNNEDIDNVEMVFNTNYSDYEAQMALVNEFNLPFTAMGKTKTQLTATILKARRGGEDFKDEFEIELPKNLKIDKYGHVIDWFLSEKSKPTWNHFKNRYNFKSLDIEIQNLKYRVAWGGFHGIKTPYFWKMKAGEAPVINSDVNQYYPSLAVRYGLFSRNVDSEGVELYKQIMKNRLAYKQQKHPLANPLKIVLNGTYGGFIHKGSALYDPRQGRSICVYGQLFLLDLIEKIEEVSQIVNVNTDGVAAKPTDIETVPEFNKILKEWENRTGMVLESEKLIAVYQKDVNNYIWVDENQKVKRKGIYAAPEPFKCDEKIVSEGVFNYFINGISPADTVNNCTDLRLFQRIIDIGKYDYFVYAKTFERLPHRVIRTFVTNEPNYKEIKKGRETDKSLTKINNLPPNVRVENKNINGLPIPNWLDKNYYIKAIEKAIDELKSVNRQKTFGDFQKVQKVSANETKMLEKMRVYSGYKPK